MGYSGTGSFTQSGGTNAMLQLQLSLGDSARQQRDLQSQRTGTLSANQEFVGYSGTGNFTQSGGTNTISSYLHLGSSSGSSGTYSLSAGSLSIASDESVGYSGTGNFTQSGGTNTISGYNSLYVGQDTGSSGTYSLSGSGQLSAPNEYVGYDGTATFTQSGGTNTVSSDSLHRLLAVAEPTTSTAEYSSCRH